MSTLSRSGIYQIINIRTGDCYIGKAKNIRTRWEKHRWFLRLGTHHSNYLQNAWNFYGEDAFEFRVVQFLPIECLGQAEAYWAHFFGEGLWRNLPEYNIADIDPATGNGIVSAETREKLRIASTGKKLSDETKRKLSEINTGPRHPQFGKPRSEEAKRKTGEANAGENNWNWGGHHSKETIQKMKDAKAGENHNMFGVPRSKETREKLREAHSGKKGAKRSKFEFTETGRAFAEKFKSGRPIIGTEIQTGGQVVFYSINSAGNAGFSTSGIRSCLEAKYESYDGYIWKDYKVSPNEKPSTKSRIRPGLYIVATEIITGLAKLFISKMATERSGFTARCVGKCLSGTRKTHKGHTWRYATPEEIAVGAALPVAAAV